MKEKFYDVHVEATDEVKKAVAKELEVPDPDEETARAILEEQESDSEGD